MINSLKVGLVQHSNTEDLDSNLEKSSQGILKAAAKNAQLIILQELHRSLYFCQTEDFSSFNLAETIPGHSTQILGQLARELGVVIVASLFEKRAIGLYHNTAVVLDKDGKIAGKYRKMHIPNDPGFCEKFYFTPGDLGFEPINTSVGLLGVMVCWDQWFPEAARLMAMKGAQILIYPTAIGWDSRDSQNEQIKQKEAWIIAQRAHAIYNGIPVISCNRVGYEANTNGKTEGILFWGNSFIAGSQGEILAHASEDQEEVVTATIDLQHSETVRCIWPYLRDRRIDHYQDLLKIYRD
ncbi:nitrilase/cyanide hydratase and apolipoprotein N-acyltransferase [cyanobacterium endosymbiont of Rhopalodia gibberula]|uniref:carbon-nitrogen hydrolase n=1 Tax=cyanobacterium endosymbiont of Rhopalodia gibberula TaxID=1763363 RepID=UPI000DC7238E|nr:carbon-nitrogen hydrolase [cyanobacterium endosymbiont of Rhopalodia gibberula]BBA79317.1 nitrilase/cyanide hydratase and apolipoprotein N-acyltransferase [cyanobacterium endosymbiont of Rhopalodia gibberula]